MKGTVVIGGHRIPVIGVRLIDGRFEVLAEAPGPFPAFNGEPATVFGEDGRGIMQGGSFTVREVRDGEWLRISVDYRIEEVTGEKMTYSEYKI